MIQHKQQTIEQKEKEIRSLQQKRHHPEEQVMIKHSPSLAHSPTCRKFLAQIEEQPAAELMTSQASQKHDAFLKPDPHPEVKITEFTPTSKIKLEPTYATETKGNPLSKLGQEDSELLKM